MGQENAEYRWVVVPVPGNWGQCRVGRLGDLYASQRGEAVSWSLGGLKFPREQAERMVRELNLRGWADVESGD